jgi:tetratricopeptide (TPR) repeat protein
MYQRLGRYDDAIRTFSDSIAREPSASAYSNLGTALYYAARYEEAAAAFEKAIALRPRYYVYWRNLGDAYRWVNGGKAKADAAFVKAIEFCDETIRVNSAEAVAHAMKGGALAKLGRERQARAAILRALELEPKDPTLAYEAALVANLSGAEEEAATRLAQSLRLGFNPTDAEHDPEFANLRKNGTLQAVISDFRSNAQNK